MQHLKLEELARLVEEEASPEETEHLASCELCRQELTALQRQTEVLLTLPPLPVPDGGWDALERRLHEEGLIREAPYGAPGRWWHSPALRAAAALLLFATGGAAGWTARTGYADTASAPTALFDLSVEPEAALRTSEAAYLAALTRYAEAIGATDTHDPLSQLAALEGIVLTTRAALEDAPADPIINGYHLAALGQREALLKRIAAAPGAEWF